MELRIGIAGAAGRMGRMVASEARVAGVILAGGIDRAEEVPPGDMLFVASVRDLAGRCDVLVDFTHVSAVCEHAAVVAEAGIGWVLGTTGLGEPEQAAVAAAAARTPIVQAANFSPGVNLVLALAERMAAALPAGDYDAEILEMHHRQKVDAPSGTALALGRAVARGRGQDFDSVREFAREGETGARPAGGIGFAALRGGQVVGEHTVLFAGATEHISLTHRAFDRRSFAAGAVRAAMWLYGRPPGLYGMGDVLGLS